MNALIKDYARTNAVYLWQIAEKLGLHDSNFSRKLRHELTAQETEKIIRIIDDLAKNTIKGGESND